jgi:NAD(P)-dependent dehydrogenase (short-subunit alcohol dehydrogenase family)
MKLEGAVALVTGGASGIGAATTARASQSSTCKPPTAMATSP